MKVVRLGITAILIALLIVLLIVTKDLMIPFVITIFLFIVLKNSAQFLALKLPSFIRNSKTRNFIGLGISVIALAGFLAIVYLIINQSVTSIIREFPKYELIMQEKIVSTQLKIDQFGVKNQSAQTVLGHPSAVGEFIAEIHIAELLSNTLSAIPVQKLLAESSAIFTGMAENIAMILIYLVFLSLEYKHFIHKMAKFTQDHPRRMKKINAILLRINEDFITYINVKFIASFFTGLLSYFVLILFNVDFAPFWAFVLFLLNFIPAIGPTIAVLMPVLLSVFQFESLGMVIALAISLTSIHGIIGTFLEPRYQGKVLNLSPLVILISLGIWGKIWGIIGMFLSVPIMVGINIVLSQFAQTRTIASFLSASGELTPLINGDDDEIDRKAIEASIQI